MFGIIWSAIVGIGAMISCNTQIRENNYSKNKAIENDRKRIQRNKVPNGTYLKFKNGKYGYYTYNDEQIYHSNAPNGDHIITDLHKEKVYRNITEEQKQLTFNINKNNANDNRVAISTGLNGMTYYGNDSFGNPLYINRGVEYRDINTYKKYYVVRLPLTDPAITINKNRKCITQYSSSEWIEFYMSENGKLVCITDEERKNNPSFVYRKDIKEFINYFNLLQRGKNGGWHKLIRNDIPNYIDNNTYAECYYCREQTYHSVYELKMDNDERELLKL